MHLARYIGVPECFAVWVRNQQGFVGQMRSRPALGSPATPVVTRQIQILSRNAR